MFTTQVQRAEILTAVWRQVGLGALLLTLVIGLSACGGREAEEADTATTPDRMGGAPIADTIDVTLSEHEIQMPAELPAGLTVFRVSNNGSEEHSFEVEYGEVEAALEENLQPGEASTLQVDLEAGTYVAYCPLSDHAERGMRLSLTVADQQESGKAQ